MKTIVYVKVQINSEDNLPEAKGVYIFGWDKSRTVLSPGVYMMPFDPNDYREAKKDLSEYDYWLKPVELPDEEEANNKADELGEREDGNRQKYIDGNYTEGFMDCFKWIIDKLTK